MLAAGPIGCGGSQKTIATETHSPESWTKRSIWTEKSGDRTLVMVVGRASNASLDQGLAMDNAEQDARERLALHLGATVVAFRQRLGRIQSIKTRRNEDDPDDPPKGGAQATEDNVRGGRAIAEAAVEAMDDQASLDEQASRGLVRCGRMQRRGEGARSATMLSRGRPGLPSRSLRRREARKAKSSTKEWT